MKYIDLRLRQPDRMLHPMQAFIRHENAVRYEELLTWSIRPESGIEYALFYVEADLRAYREAIGRVESILDHRIAPIEDGAAHVWACQETRPADRSWRRAFEDRRLVVVPPIRFDDEAAMGMTLVGDGGDLQRLLDDLPDDIEVTINGIGSYDRRGGTLAGALSDRQLAAVETAMALGYYEVPRGASLADVADALGCAESTASVLVRRAERSILSRVLSRYGGDLGDSHQVARNTSAVDG